MNISELSIRRPVLATVLTLIILLFGAIGYFTLGVREYPSVDNPIISVSCSYPGANADVIESQITEPLEQNINGIPGIRSLTSVSQQGSSRITVEFELSVDLETAANDVRDKVSRAQRNLPRDCDPPTVSEADADAMPILMVAIQSDKRSLLELSEIADLTVKEQLQTIPEVSSVMIWGEKRYCMRLWLDPVKMSGYSITPMDVKNALDRENVELPSGSIEGNTTELSIRTMGQMHTTEEFNNLVIKEQGGRIIRFSDIGRAELAPRDIKSYMKMNGVPMVGVAVVPQPGANHINIADAVHERMEQMRKDLPEDVHFDYGFDNTKFIRASINEVETTVYEAFVLVIIIIFLFLRDWRVTLVPCIVIPVSLIGAFFIMYLCGFSINVLSMLAIVLSVGLVVDDAIVMTENIYIRIERGMKPFEAGIEGAKEIFFAVISTTVTLVAVFLPIVFMEGTTGRLFREFSFVVAGSVIISSFAALTFTPMLATKLLVRREEKNWFYRKTEPFFEGMNRIYLKWLTAFLRRRWVAIPVMVVALGAAAWMWISVPAEMAPLEDRSSITIRTSGPEGVTYEYMRDYTEDINRLADSLMPDAEFITARVSSGSGNIQITLKDLNERDYSQMDVAERLSKAVRTKTDARAFVQQQSTFGGRRGAMPVQYVLQATNIEKLQEVLPKFMAQVYDNPTFQMADVDLKFSKPEVRLSVNREKANMMGVSTKDIAQTLQYGLSGQRMGYLYMNGKQYEIVGEINRQQRNDPGNLKAIYMRSADGQMIQMENLVDLMESIAPPKLYRYNRFVSATISAGLADGKTIGEGLDEMDKIAKATLDDTFRTALAGDSKEFRESSSSLIFAFALAL
ncbi:MAG: efflux RND transporter permease subunit, partial [Bacteroidaceae bacterium]|nr:efflux RND transporter permease subunit [Bacteroidaceae bacterium]